MLSRTWSRVFRTSPCLLLTDYMTMKGKGANYKVLIRILVPSSERDMWKTAAESLLYHIQGDSTGNYQKALLCLCTGADGSLSQHKHPNSGVPLLPANSFRKKSACDQQPLVSIPEDDVSIAPPSHREERIERVLGDLMPKNYLQ